MGAANGFRGRALAAIVFLLLASGAWAWHGTRGAAMEAEATLKFLPALVAPDKMRATENDAGSRRFLARNSTSDEAPPTKPPAAARDELPAWRRYAALSKESGEAPIIAIVIDDLGHSEREFTRAMSLEGVTLAILPYPGRAAEFARRAREGGFEILLHMPMEPSDPSADPGPNALLTKLSETELRRRLALNLSRFEGYVGINNHMGSKFSRDRRAMTLVLGEIEARGLLYLDSVTIGSSAGAPLAAALRIPFASRKVFLDSKAEQGFIEAQLRLVETMARRDGHTVAIGHPYDETLDLLRRWMPEARKRGFEFVPISTIAALECAC